MDRNLALLAVLLRLAEGAVHYTTTLFSVAALALLGGADYLGAFDSRQLPAIGPYRLATMVPMFFYEVGLGFRLLVKGADLGPRADRRSVAVGG